MIADSSPKGCGWTETLRSKAKCVFRRIPLCRCMAAVVEGSKRKRLEKRGRMRCEVVADGFSKVTIARIRIIKSVIANSLRV